MKKLKNLILILSILANSIFFHNNKNQTSTEFTCNFENNNNNDLVELDSKLFKHLEAQAEILATKFNYSKSSVNNCFKNLLRISKTDDQDLRTSHWKATKYDDDDKTTYDNYIALQNAFNDINLRNGQKALTNLEPIFKMMRIKEKTEYGNYTQDYSFHILNMYNYLSKFFGKENVSKWLFNIRYVEVSSLEDFPVGLFLINEKWGYSQLVLSSKFNEPLNSYDPYWNSTSAPPHTFIHEYGHIFDFALQYEPLALNTRILPNKYSKDIFTEWQLEDNLVKNHFLEPWISTINNEKINEDINDNYSLKK